MVCSRLQLHEADTWCSRHRQYCNPHEHKARGDVESEESVSMRKGIGHGPCKKHYGKNGQGAAWERAATRTVQRTTRSTPLWTRAKRRVEHETRLLQQVRAR